MRRSPPPSWRRCTPPALRRTRRSEEHTSELQSRSDLVCRLLLEKKKKRQAHPVRESFQASQAKAIAQHMEDRVMPRRANDQLDRLAAHRAARHATTFGVTTSLPR